tara:strand:- start:1280 stop:1705 length:426 start_codon:yes stop_codon:yes gene_type:complete
MAEYDDMIDEMRRGAQKAESCPAATQNVELNLENRQKALDTKEYGPANPGLDDEGGNQEFWQRYADRFNDSVENVMTMRCGNCSFFDTSEDMQACIATGIGDEGDPESAVDAGELGYCSALDFKCASQRVCIIWAGASDER